MHKYSLFGLVLLAFPFTVQSATEASADNELKSARQQIAERFGGIPHDNINTSPIKGLYQVMLPPRMFYVSADGRFAVDGDLIDLQNKTNVSEPQRGSARLAAIEAIGADSMISFKPKKTKHVVTVFTDIDCTYCRKLHSEMKSYNDAGIEIRYLAYPRAGIGSESYNKAVSVWCSKDRNKAMTEAKGGKNIDTRNCENPVAQHFTLGGMMGIRGTPALVLPDGQIAPGYIPADRLKAALEGNAQ